MESNKEEALKAKEIAEKRFAEKDFAGAKTYALKAKTLWPGLDGIAQMVATFEVYVASAAKFNGEVDYYSVLGLKPGADKYAVKRQYRKLAVLLHPDKNKCVGADGAFRLVSEAWTLLSDSAKRGTYDLKRNQGLTSYPTQTNSSSLHTAGYTSHGNCFGPPTPQPRLDTFWTVCTSCKVQYEYLRKYLNKRLSCKNCRGIFVAVETGAAPVTGSFPYSPYTYVPNNGYGNHGSDGVSYAQSNSTYYMGNGVSGYHTGQGYEYVSNLSFQWNSPSGSSTVIVSPNGSAAPGNNAVYQPNGKLHKVRQRSGTIEKHSAVNTVADTGPHLSSGASGSSAPNVVKPDKRRKVSVGSEFRNGSSEAAAAKSSSEVKTVSDPKPNSSYELPAKRCSAMPAFDARKLLMDKARTEIRKRLEEMKQAAAAIAAAKAAAKLQAESGQSKMVPLSKPSKSGPVSIVVPDPDFHDFDKDRAEECFKPKQIWALYDEEDGMPRLYCLIRQIISVKPFKILISYLSSKTDAEFGSVNWIDRGFTKSCGHFRAWTSDVVEQVNIFSHLLSKEKAGRGGCVRVYPRSGDIWAVYRNWSPDWDRSTPAEVRHQYEMVEVIDDYSEELGVCVTPLVKLEGFKTVYQRDPNEGALRWIPRKEMLRFSHQVPSWSLKGENGNLPEGCWDLDPAATPDELLHADAGIEVEA